SASLASTRRNVGQLQLVDDAGRKKCVYCQQVIASKRNERHVKADIWAGADPSDDEHRAKCIGTMVDEIAISRSFYCPEAREASIERVSKPMDEIAAYRRP